MYIRCLRLALQHPWLNPMGPHRFTRIPVEQQILEQVSFCNAPLAFSSKVCYIKFREASSVGVAQHLTNTVFIDRALIVVPCAEGC
nr:PREDICTED: serine/arginine-rich splicing factor 11-like [Haliaeetus albicilla]